MPIEFSLLNGAPCGVEECPACYRKPFQPFLRGTVQRNPRAFWIGRRRPYCALMCQSCKELIGYEDPVTEEVEITWKKPKEKRPSATTSTTEVARRVDWEK